MSLPAADTPHSPPAAAKSQNGFATATPLADGERKTVTALFADIKGSTAIEQNLDPEEARAIIDPALDLMIAAVNHYEGYIVQSTGDGVFAIFGAPLAHEDHPQRALYAAMRMQDGLLKYGSRLQAEGRAPIEIRVGVNTGEVVVRSIATGDGHLEYTPIGHTTNLAARLQSLARTGTIAISEDTRRLVDGYFQLKPLGPTRVKGLNDPVNLYELTGLGPMRTRLQHSAGRGLSKFVGRTAEMDALRRAADQAREGRGQIVAAIAEAGVGKSRLFFEFKAIARSTFMTLETFSVSHGKASAFLPLLELLWNYFKIVPEDDERTRREKITGRILSLDRALEDTLPYLCRLLGISGRSTIDEVEAQTRKNRALEAIKRILMRESLERPLLIIFEDLHWVDKETQSFLNLLADSIGTARILLLVNYRQEYRHEWNSKTYYAQLRLDPLGKASAAEMLSALVGDDPSIGPLKRLIIDRTEGNPFFVEEMVQVLFDEGILLRHGPAIKLTRPHEEIKIPATVQAILATRIDRLEPDAKSLLQTLAVIGKDFKLTLLRAVAAESQSELEAELTRLQLAEFIYEQPAVGDVEYTFKHALTHDVAYQSVLHEHRRLLHERIGAAIESLFASKLGDHVVELAHHFSRGANPAKAVKYGLRALQQAVYRGSNAEALFQFDRAMQMLKALPDDDERAELELDLRNAAYGALGDSKGYGSFDVEQSTARAVELCGRPGIDWEKSWLALFGVFFVWQLRPDVTKAAAIAAELVARAEQHRRLDLEAEALNWLGYARMVSGDFTSAELAFDGAWKILESLENLGESDADGAYQARAIIGRFGTRQNNRALSGWNLWFLGYPDRALERIEVATAIAEAPGAPKNMLADVQGFASYVNELRRDSGQMRSRAESRLALASEYGYFTGRVLSQIYIAWSDVLAGEVESGIERMKNEMSELRNTGSEYISERCLAFLASALGRVGRYDEALQRIEESLKIIADTGQSYYKAELHRLKAELRLARGDRDRECVEQLLRAALEIATNQGAQSWKLRAAASLARLLRDNGKKEEAKAILGETYSGFREGFDTLDLKDAKALLIELEQGPASDQCRN